MVSEEKKPVDIDLPEIVAPIRSPSHRGSSKANIILEKLGSGKRLLVIAGENVPLETFSKWDHPKSPPILCDSLSTLRETPVPSRILRFENLLRNKGFRERARPDAILQLGPLPTSKTLRKWLGELDVPRVVIEPRGKHVDPLTTPSLSYDLDFPLVSTLDLSECEKEWTSLWVESEKQVETKLDLFFSEESDWFEGKLARLLSVHLPKVAQLQVANSMPIRDLEWFWKGSDLGRTLSGNRGVNGIDGTLGTALGIAHDSQNPSYLLTGELAFLHDSNALLASRSSPEVCPYFWSTTKAEAFSRIYPLPDFPLLRNASPHHRIVTSRCFAKPTASSMFCPGTGRN